jgi:hypothetical protein
MCISIKSKQNKLGRPKEGAGAVINAIADAAIDRHLADEHARIQTARHAYAARREAARREIAKMRADDAFRQAKALGLRRAWLADDLATSPHDGSAAV